MAFFRDRFDQTIQSIDDRPVQFFKTLFRMSHGIGDPRHHVLAISHLRVHHRLRGDDLATSETAEIACNGCGPDINGEAINLIHSAGFNIDNLLFHPNERP